MSKWQILVPVQLPDGSIVKCPVVKYSDKHFQPYQPVEQASRKEALDWAEFCLHTLVEVREIKK